VLIIEKSEIINTVCICAKMYKENLENRNIMFIYKDEKTKFIEAKFLKSNFLHLTGIKPRNLKANEFYDKCIHNRILESEIRIQKRWKYENEAYGITNANEYK